MAMGLLLLASLIFLIVPVLYVIPGFLLLIKKTKYSQLFFLMFIIAFSLPMLRYIPSPREDAADHYYTAYIFSRFNNIIELFQFMYNPTEWLPYDYHNFPLYSLILYLFSGTYRYSIISFLMCVITYFCYLSPLKWMYEKINISKWIYSLAFLAILLQNNIRFTVSGMRYVVAHAILFFLLFFDLLQDRKLKIYWLLYLIPILIHPASLMVIAIRVVFYGLQKLDARKVLGFVVLYPIAVAILPSVANFVKIPYITKIADKMANYSSNSFYAVDFSKSVKIRIVVGVVFTLIYVYIYLKNAKKFEGALSRMLDMTYYLSVLSLSMVFYLNLIDRILFILLPCIIIALVIICSYETVQTTIDFKRIRIWLGLFILLGIIYNYNYPFGLLDFTWYELLVKNVFDFIRDIPVYVRAV